MTFGQKLKQLREERNLSREDLAQKLDVSYWALSKYEKGERTPDYSIINRIADFFNVSTDYLLGRVNTPQFQYLNLATLNYVQIGSKIKEAREALGLSQAELGQKIGIAELDIKYFERGKRKISHDIFKKLGQALHKPLSYFIPDLVQVSEPNQVDIIIPTKALPLLGKITAGSSSYAVQEKIGEFRVSKYLDADFGLIVNGDSMIGANINPGDIAVVKKAQNAEHGDIVAALVNGGETTLKYLLKEGDTWLLRAANPKYKDIILNPEDDRIQGIVVKVEKKPANYMESIETKQPNDDWSEVANEAAKYGISPVVAKRLIKNFGRLKEGLPDNEDDKQP